MSSLAHFTVYSIFPRGCFSVCLLARAVEGLECRTGRSSTHAFYFVVSQVVTNQFAQGVCGQLFIKR